MQSKALTPKKYLDQLPKEQRKELEVVRKVILKHLPKGYKETMQYGMISYVVPLSLYPDGYLNKKDTPLPYASLASQKNHMSVYLMNIYSDQNGKTESWFKKEYLASGKKMDIGKSCVRFKKVDDLPLDVIGKAIALTPVSKFIKQYELSRKKK
ncbi:MAG TPA: DUF1801 domain-containing protein [Candidatus Doudnabacteria bacterium]|nr:DUF1801 domain-containing protein [Candidatus Doudnabacteria bacterium]